MKIVDTLTEYKLLDMSDGMKLEDWNGIILSRPDPQVIWNKKINENLWNKAKAVYHRSKTGGGSWEYKSKVPDRWQVDIFRPETSSYTIRFHV